MQCNAYQSWFSSLNIKTLCPIYDIFVPVFKLRQRESNNLDWIKGSRDRTGIKRCTEKQKEL